MRFGYWMPVFGGWLRNIPDEGMEASWDYVRRLTLRSEETGPYMRKYLYTKPSVDVETRMRVYNLIRDMTADAFGGWNLVVALQAGGGLTAQRFMMNRTYDMPAARAAALKAAGAR